MIHTDFTEKFKGVIKLQKNFNLLGHKIDIAPIEEKEIFEGEKKKVIGKKQAEEAMAILQKYKQGKINLEKRIVNGEQWYKLRHWEEMRVQKKDEKDTSPEPASAWLFNSIAQKHADVMDNFPEANVLPREESDEGEAKKLSVILPAVFEQTDFEGTYSVASWDKLKHGTACYGIFWNSRKDGGIGDVDIKEIDLLNIFWEPGITDIQDSSNLFIVSLKNKEAIEKAYPFLKNSGGGAGSITIQDYVHDDAIDISDKVAVIDWYYKTDDGKLHYCKICQGEVIFASENEEGYENGWYEHGQYPVVFDTLFPEKGTPSGFGYISICKDPQMYIDKLSKYMLQNAFIASKVRYMVSDSSGLNEDEFCDLSCDVVHCSGNISEEKAVQIKPQSLGGIYYNLLQFKTDELKETSANRDFSQGSTASGVTSGAAIAALQEAGSKTSRDMISASYRAFSKICYMVIELIRQFYDEKRSFRITGETGEMKYEQFSNEKIRPVSTEGEMQRKPIFDIKIKAQRKNPFSKMSQNELAKELLNMGFFNPQNAEQALMAAELMEFEGKEKVIGKIQENQMMLRQLQQAQLQIQQLTKIVMKMRGGNEGVENSLSEGQEAAPNDTFGAR